MQYEFKDKVAIVIGASYGIGSCVAMRLAENGAIVCFVSRSGAQKIVEGLKKKGFNVEDFKMDARDEKAINDMVSYVIKKYGRIDILVNSQAINQCVKIEKIALDDWENIIGTNLTSIFLSCKACVPYMKKQKYGKIINISSVAARNRSPVAGVHYVATKTAILGFSRQLAFELGPFGVNVNVLCPGQTKTPMLMNSMTAEQQKALVESVPLKRIAEPDDQANVVMFLASDESSYMTGAVLDVNGGQI